MLSFSIYSCFFCYQASFIIEFVDFVVQDWVCLASVRLQ